ncbi:DUF6520 family protein [Flavobacterium johnsoniae]|uniref:Uncharacterized protein n=1 Tax=Flavobacterium johnsoniae (strain ATCC 17061 / DSM 2064 / JCM 8514 / BCRC 14874 / CCUG 350202 / NBRC 14942 / NCIMB 11054 / UW101) TaxID=376686 RepID=A5FDZ4_FLAJ1|nr:DUF6520 family protein [Flavobacterium johnsoniae]ABQ06573.1 hypothetical protein Fjoh_3559 [Flavobacterium johnsoniae UW101]OXE99808.1 hypothetical protein B0A63_10930 [Flavobacterium johnsoniae UW101]WQG82323.1 DUF6520 family protein [Flavobacterium johnsoniae UW101]SHK79939.1 hypothetical protein SAMN05444146_2310 [Flavobacterium johnsoniae]
MKSNVFKIGLPIAVIAFGLASAASTSSINSSSKPLAQNGYEHISISSACNVPVAFCDEIEGQNCTAPETGRQLYSQPSNCVTPLKRSNP